jgi:mono/diheme cytochrome c family protein
VLGWVLVVVLALALAGTILLQIEKQPESSPVGRGEQLALNAGCFACHGRGDGEPRFNRRQANDKWTARNNPTMWDNGITEAKVLVDWITNGAPADRREQHRRLFIQMPAYKDRLKPAEIEAIAAWILAEGLKLTQADALKRPVEVPAAPPQPPDELLVLGDRLSRKHGCYQCHGELGQGGVANSGSFKGYVPGFFGQDFLVLTKQGDRAELLHWIDHGRGRDIESGALGKIARNYFDGQATQMPGYREALSLAEKKILVDYMLFLNAKGPLPAAEIERFVTLIDGESSQ